MRYRKGMIARRVLALAIVLLFGATPVIGALCDLVCHTSVTAEHDGHHAGHHPDPAAAAHGIAGAVLSDASNCAHPRDVAVVMTAAAERGVCPPPALTRAAITSLPAQVGRARTVSGTDTPELVPLALRTPLRI